MMRDNVQSTSADLREIGAALVNAATSDQPTELSDDQRATLVRAPLPDTLDAIIQQLPTPVKSYHPIGRIFPMTEGDLSVDEQRRLRTIATRWATECLKGFDDPHIVEHIGAATASEKPLLEIADIVRSDNRLRSDDRKAVLAQIAPTSTPSDPEVTAESPTGAFIRSVRVAGFRGIGSVAEIEFDDDDIGPGLTVVYGANGSGKSSFVEALDVLLTGNTGRFEGRGAEWTSALTNVHKPNGGIIEATFAVGSEKLIDVTLTRRWAAYDPISGEHDATLTATLQTLGWLDALEKYRPIIGYAELGPLFDEAASNGQNGAEQRAESPLAKHIRLRAGTAGASLANFLSAAAASEQIASPFYDELVRWYILHSAMHTVGHMGIDPRLFVPTDSVDANRNDPDQRLATTSYGPIHTLTLALTWIVRTTARITRNTATALARIVTEGTTALMQLPKQRITSMIDRSHTTAHGEITSTRPPTRDPRHQAGVSSGASIPTKRRSDHQSRMLAAFPAYTSRARIYCEMLAEAAHEIHLREFSKDVAKIWEQIRPGSTVQFKRLALRQAYTATAQRARHMSIDLRLDDAHGAERGVLSQGELHALALSVFLPTMMRPESPFGFAMIDDPVQAMDEHGVDGLVQVLANAAETL